MKQPILELKNVNYTYPGTNSAQVLTDLSFKVTKGEWLAVLGHNGSGKSTMAKIINGLITATSGEIIIDGETLTTDNVWQLRRKIGMVFQNPDNQFVGATVEDDLAFGMENLGIPRKEMIKRVHDVLKTVGMSEFSNIEPARLSGGQKQRVAIAGIMALRPAILILDEATSMLDPAARISVLETICQLKKKIDLTVISITHDLQEAAKANRILILKQGKLAQIGPVTEIFGLGEKLLDFGLTLPFTEQLSAQLRKNGVNIPSGYLTEERLASLLCKLASKT